MPGHRLGANRELASSSAFGRRFDRPGQRSVDWGGLLLNAIVYLGAICVIVWLVLTFTGASDDPAGDAPQLVSAPAPTVAPTVASPGYFEDDDVVDGDGYMSDEGSQTADFWASRPDPAIPPSQDPLTRPHY
ncbi:hypothetical protein D2V17_09350 [Aurantiacibacter xanthus]|uniref:Uncharacterized protein n=2 Tax=Aurantiacibacter xanthus TaxID=1784712 RepID=A0A3A1P4L6_9SPHN|nr:hypothetical protein D2V17_09350 [Aurantiacibacter xanthus]